MPDPTSRFFAGYQTKGNWLLIFFFNPQYFKAICYYQIMYFIFCEESELEAVHIIDSFVYFYTFAIGIVIVVSDRKEVQTFGFSTLLISENIK